MFVRGQELRSFVTGVSKDGRLCSLWVQTDFDSFAELDELIQQIDANDRVTFKPVAVNGINVGDVVIAKYNEDGMWYRAHILEKASGKCKVFFMDYGNEETVSVSDMIYGPEQYFNIPPLVTKFIFADFQAADEQELTEDEMVALQEHLQNIDGKGQILHEGSSGVPPTLRVFEENLPQVPIAHTLIQNGCGVMYENDHFRFANIPRAAMSPGKAQNVYVSHTDSAVKFCLQLVSEEAILQDLEEKLQEIVPNLGPIPMQHIKKGAVCIANFEDVYYRGVVSTVDNAQKTAVVYFIDYGNSAEVPLPEVLYLPEEYCVLPAQAIECSLKGSAVNSTDFSKLIDSETVYARVLQVLESGLHIVDLSNNAPSRQASQEPVPSSRPSVNTVITSYPAMSLEEDVLLDVCISHVEENDRFYCQLLGNAKALDSLMCAIQDADLVPLKGAIREGTCCLARSPSDGVIYRAQMLSGSVAGPHVKYVDFGVTETVQPSSLYVLPSDLADIPARAVCCSLSDSADLTSAQVKETLNKYHSKKPLIAEVACKTPRSYEVVLYDTSVSDEPLVSMMRSNQSRPAASTQKISQSPALASGTLQPPNITLGKPFSIIGSLALKPTVFFAQFASFPVEDLESLSEGLHAFYSNNNVPSLSNCSAGDVCVTEFSEDGAHYRARVKARRDDLALVSFVDYGNQEKKNISELKVIAPQFCQVPVAGALFDLGKYYDVIDPDQLAAAIVEQELTVMCDGQSKDGYTCKLPQMECNMAILPLLRRKDAEAAPPPAQTRPAANPSPRMREKQKIVELGADVVRGRQQVLVAYAEDPEHLSLQLVSQKPALDAMMDAMGDFCNSAPVTHLQVALTDCVIAKYSEDGEWYRASVTGLKSGGQQYEVYFVDYGNYDTVSLCDLREIPANFSSLPAQAVRCSLNGIAPEFAGTPWDTEQNERLCEALLEVELTADFVDHSPGSNTFSVDLFSSDGANFNRSFLQSCGRLSRKYGGGESGLQRHAPPPQAHVAPQPAVDTKIIPFKQIAVDEYMDVVVPYGLGIDNFNCQVTSDVAELDGMQEAIAQDYAAPGNPLPRPAPGQFCCALYAEDEVWYRAQIQAVSGHTATVHFVDYGNVESVDVRSLRALKDKYCRLPRQAIQCELFGVEPVGAEWSEEANNTFLEMATSQDSIVACPVLKKSDGVYVFELVAGTDPANSVPYHEKLIKDGYAKACALPQQTPTNAPLPDRPSKAQQPITLVNNEPVDVYIAHVDSVSRIYCQLLSEAPKLEEVMANLAENYSNLGPSEMRLKNAGVGVVCAAKYSEDGEWYRGEILSVAPQQYHIRFVDYGNEEWVGSDDVRMLTKQLLSLPPQAIPVSLDGVSVRPGQEDAAKAIIEQHIEDTVKVVPHSRSRDGVHMAAISVNGASLADLLVQARVASAPARPVARPSPVAPTPVAQPPRGPQPIVGKYQINRALEPGCQYEVLISWVESPLEFYCQYCESEDILVTMAEKLKAEYDHLKLNEMCLPSLPTGTACVAYYEEDGNWYRGTVLKVRGQQAMVKYIDYGNRSKVALSKVKAPSSELIEQEMEAVQCSLKGVSAPAGGEWPEAVIALFQELSAVQPRLKVIDLEGDHYVVDLITKDCRSIAERIVSLMQPKKGGWSNNRASVEGSQNGGGGRYGDRQQKYGASNESGAGDRSQYDNRRNNDYGSSRPVDGSDGGWGDRRNKDAGRPQEDGYRSNKSNFGGNAESRNNRDTKPAPVPSAPFAATAPREKLAYPDCVLMSGVTDCYIASVSSPLKFYIQYVSQEDELADFANKVSSEYSSLRPGERAVTSTAVDEPCCALFSDDAWYRARIIGVQGAQVTVLFVDYGNSETVNLSEVRCLTPELARTPPYAIECKLKDMNQYTDEDLAKLNALAAEESFKVQFLGASVPCEVAMWLGEENLLDVLPSGRQSAAIPEIPATGAIQDYPPLPKPAPGAAYVSHIVSPGEFYLQFAEHEDQLEELVVETAPPTPVLQQAVVGSACAAQFSEDDAWYRARIVAVNGPTATVQFVDHGNCEEVDVATLQEIHNAATPPVCVQCQLGPEKTWSEDEKEKFSELVLEKQLHVNLQGDAPPYIAIVTDQETGKVINEEFTAPEVPVSAPSASAPSASDFEYPPLDFSTFVGRIPVYVSHVDSPGKFYIQPVSVEDDLSTMLERLEEQYGEGGRPVQNPRVDMACCAKFTEDEVLYRARIVAIEDGAVTVQFVDYGNCDTPPAEQIYEMAPDTPPMAVQCSLTALAQPPGGWSDDINAKLLELTEDKVLTAEFHATGETCEVSLYEGEQNIGELLRAEFTQIESTTPAGATASEMEPEPVAASSVEEPPTESAPAAPEPAAAAAASTESSPEEKHKGGRRRRLSRLPCPLEPVEAYISAVSSPGNFYVQPMYVDDDVAAMEAKLSALYSAGGEPLDNPEAGQICCAQASDDGEYYRALITSIGEGGDENMAEVLYVDYGNSEMQRLDTLKKLDESVLGQPVMTLICGLAGIEGEEWSQEETTKFMEETEEKRVTIVFKSFKEPYNVTVLERSEDVAKRLFTYRLKTGEDTPATSQPEAAVAQTDEVDAEEVQPVAAPVTDQPPTAAEQEAEEEITNDEEEEQEADQEVPSAAPSAAPCLLPVRERVAVTVSWVTSPSQFYVQLADNEDALAELEERLHEFYEDEDDGKIPESIHPGLVCAAKYASEEEEEKWYRAQVLSVDNDTVTVFFLDWGNSESIPTSSLRPLAQDFLSLPHQCVKCSLSNVQPITDEWPDEAATWFEETVTECESLQCRALHKTTNTDADDLWEVELFDEAQQSLAATMKHKGYAIEITEDEQEQESMFATTIPTEALDRNSKVQVSVSHVESPDSFWVQVKPNPVLEQLEDDMSAFYSASSPPVASDVAVGNCYAIRGPKDDKEKEDAKEEEEEEDVVEVTWDRVRVVALASGFVTVRYVDYGYEDDVPAARLFPLRAGLASVPAQCRACRLLGVAPITDQEEEREKAWTADATDLLRELTMGKCLLLQIVDEDSDGKYGCRLLDMGVPVAQMLADNAVARLIDVPSQPSKADESLASLASDLSEGVQDYVDGLIAGAKAILQAESSRDQSREAPELLEVTYLHGDGPDNFYVQLAPTNDEFRKLEDSLEETFQVAEQDPDVELTEDENILVQADEQYYRASVLQVQDEQVEVSLVDYGGSRTVGKEACRALGAVARERLFSVPSQCMACRLEGIEAAQWTQQAIEFFQGLVQGERLCVRILSQTADELYSVYMYVLRGEEKDEEEEQDPASSVNMQLVQAGHATVVPGCQLDIDLDLEADDNALQECSFLEETKLHSNSIGSLHDESLYTPGTKDAALLSPLQYSVGAEVRMRVSAVTDPDNIVLIDCTDTDTFTVLSQQMHDYYNDASSEAGVITSPQPGQSAAVLINSTWQRCQVVKVEDDQDEDGGAVEVLLVDTGLKHSLPTTDLRELDQRFSTLPTQACRMRLDTHSQHWPEDVRTKLEEACGVGQEDNFVTVTITSDTDGFTAKIVNKDGVELSSLCRTDGSPELTTPESEAQGSDNAEAGEESEQEQEEDNSQDDSQLTKPIPQPEGKTERAGKCEMMSLAEEEEDKNEEEDDQKEELSGDFEDENNLEEGKEQNEESGDEDIVDLSAQGNELVDAMDISTKSLKEEMEEIALELIDVVAKADDDVEVHDEGSVNSCEIDKDEIECLEEEDEVDKLESNVEDTEDQDDFEEKFEEDEYDVKTVDEISEDAEDLCDEEFEESPEVLSSSGVTKPIDDVENEKEISLDSAADRQAETWDQVIVESDRSEMPQYANGEAIAQESDGRKSAESKDVQDESSGGSILMHDVEDLVSNEEDSREYTDSGHVTTDKSQGVSYSSIEAEDFHDLEGTQLREDAEVIELEMEEEEEAAVGDLEGREEGQKDAEMHSGCDVSAGCPEEDIMQVEKGDGDAARPLKHQTPMVDSAAIV